MRSMAAARRRFVCSLVFVTDADRGKILLGKKKRGFGCGKFNGYGGKIEDGDESMAACASRELEEESGLRVKPEEMHCRGKLTFDMIDDNLDIFVTIFSFDVRERRGPFEPRETDEMIPQWFSVDDIPYDLMWEDDKYWLPFVLQGKNVDGEFTFQDHDTLLHYEVKNGWDGTVLSANNK